MVVQETLTLLVVVQFYQAVPRLEVFCIEIRYNSSNSQNVGLEESII